MAKEGYAPRDLADARGFLEELTKIENVAEWFLWEQSGDVVSAKLKRYLGNKEQFATIAQGFRDMGGQYVSAGKESKFTVKVGPGVPIPARRIEEIILDIRRLLDELEGAMKEEA